MEERNGYIKVRGTRVGLSVVINAFRDGSSAEEIVEQYPSLDQGDVYTILGYYLKNREAVDDYLRSRREFADLRQAEMEKKFPRHGRRQRLLARRTGQVIADDPASS